MCANHPSSFRVRLRRGERPTDDTSISPDFRNRHQARPSRRKLHLPREEPRARDDGTGWAKRASRHPGIIERDVEPRQVEEGKGKGLDRGTHAPFARPNQIRIDAVQHVVEAKTFADAAYAAR